MPLRMAWDSASLSSSPPDRAALCMSSAPPITNTHSKVTAAGMGHIERF